MEGEGGTVWIHLGRDIIADVPSSSSFSGVPPSFLLVIHLTRFSFLCLCLSLFLSLGRVFLSLPSTSFGLSCQPISSHPIWTGIKMEGSYQ